MLNTKETVLVVGFCWSIFTFLKFCGFSAGTIVFFFLRWNRGSFVFCFYPAEAKQQT